jgi:hypothetical protein
VSLTIDRINELKRRMKLLLIIGQDEKVEKEVDELCELAKAHLEMKTQAERV